MGITKYRYFNLIKGAERCYYFIFILSFEKSRANLNRNLKKKLFDYVVELIFFFVVIGDC